MGQITDVVIDEFKGINTEDDPTNLPKEVTNDSRNVYSTNGTFVGKRPGISTALTNVARSAPVYDILRGALRLAGTTGGPDSLFMMYNTSPSASAASYWIFNNSIEDYGVITHGGVVGLARLILAGRNRAMILPASANANWNFIEHFQGVAPYYRLATFATGDAGYGYQVGVWHRNHFILTRASNMDRAPRVIFSAFDDPITFPAANTVDIAPRGKMDFNGGMFQMGDVLYIGRARGVWIWTGANDESFVVEQTRIPFGFSGMHTWDLLEGGRAIGFIDTSINATAADFGDLTQAENIGVIEGVDGERIGDHIITLTRGAVTAANGTYAASSSRTKNWEELRGTLFVPQNDMGQSTPGTDNTLALFRDKKTGSFWRWTITAGVRLNALEVAGNQMYVGCGDGHIRRFDVTLAQDSGTNFADGAYWATPPLWFGTPHVQWSVAYIRVTGTQTSGTAPTVAIATNFGIYGAETSFTLSAAGERIGTNSAAGYYQQIRFTFAANGVQQQIRKIVIGVKPMGA